MVQGWGFFLLHVVHGWGILIVNVVGGGVVCSGLGQLMGFAVPSCLMICLEWWWYEIVTVLAGYLPRPTLAVAATGILIQTTSMMYTVPMALAGCVSARVSLPLSLSLSL